jgi:uncharacterized membrane protein YbhN (UPF0104 family)
MTLVSGNRRRRFHRARTGAIAGSVLLAVGLIAGLVVSSGLGLGKIQELLLQLPLRTYVEATLLIGVATAIAGGKWREVVARLAANDSSRLPPQAYFALSAIGSGLGQFIPAQISTGLSRAVGARAYGGKIISHGFGATLYEQVFDQIAVAPFAAATVLVLALGWDASAWIVAAGFLLFIVFAAAKTLPALLRRVVAWSAHFAILARAAEAAWIAPDLTCKLLGWSLLRLVLLTAVWAISADALSIAVPVWHIAAAFSAAMIALALAVTPGGIGVGEWTVSAVLVMFGHPLEDAARIAIVCRVLVVVASLVWTSVGYLMLALMRRARPALCRDA